MGGTNSKEEGPQSAGGDGRAHLHAGGGGGGVLTEVGVATDAKSENFRAMGASGVTMVPLSLSWVGSALLQEGFKGTGAAPRLPQTPAASSAATVAAACTTTRASNSSECCQKSQDVQACDAVVPSAHQLPCDANPTDDLVSTRSPASPPEILDTGSPSFEEQVAPATVQANVPAATPGDSPQPPGTTTELETKEGGLSSLAPFCDESARHDSDLQRASVQTFGCKAVLTEMQASFAESSPPTYVAPDFEKLLGELGVARSLVERDVEKPPPVSEPMSAHEGPSETKGKVSIYQLALKHGKTSNRRLDLKGLALHVSKNRPALDEVTGQGQQVVGIFGKTGVGKSTLIQALAGKRFHRRLYKRLDTGAATGQRRSRDGTERWVFDVEDALEDFAIGHDKISKTRCLKSYLRGQVLYLDSPGYEDTAGKEVDIATSIAFREVADRCSRMRFVVLINCVSLLEDRGGAMRGFVQLVSSLVGGDLCYRFAFTFVFTHAEVLSGPGENLESMTEVLLGHLNDTIVGTAEDDADLCNWLRWLQKCLEEELPYVFVFHPELSDSSTLAKAFEKFEPENDGKIFPAIGLQPGETPAKVVRCGLTHSAQSLLKLELDRKVEFLSECLQQCRFAELATAYTDIAGLRECIPIKEVEKADGNATDAIVRHATGLRRELEGLINDGTALGQAFGVRDAAKTFDKLVELDILARTPHWSDRNTFADAAAGDFMHLVRSIESMPSTVRAALEDQVLLPNLDAAVKVLERLKIWGEAHSDFAPLALQAERCFQACILEAAEAVVCTKDVTDLIDPTVLLLRLNSAVPRLCSLGVHVPPLDAVLAAATDRIRSSIQASRDVVQAAFAHGGGGAADDAPASLFPAFEGSLAKYATSVAHLEDISGRLRDKPGLEEWHEECRLAQQSVLDDAREELSRRKEEIKQSLKGGNVPDAMHGQVQEMIALVGAHTEAQRHEAKMNAILEDAIGAIVGAVDVMREELDKLCAQVATDCVRDPLPHIQLINALRRCAWLDEHAKGIRATEVVSSYLRNVDKAYSGHFQRSAGRLLDLLHGLLGEKAISDGDVKSLGDAWAGFDGLCKLEPAYPNFVDGQRSFQSSALNRVSVWLEERRSLLDGVPGDLDKLSAWSAAPLDAALKVCDVLLALWGKSLSSSTEAASLKEFVDGAMQRLSELADEVGRLAESKGNFTTKSTVLDAVSAWSRSGVKSVAEHIAREGHDYEALCQRFGAEVAQRHDRIWKSINDGIDCTGAEGELQSLEEARCLDAHIQSQASRCIDQLRQLVEMREHKIDAALREKIENLDFEDIDGFLQPLEASSDPLKKGKLHETWGIIAKRIRVVVDDAKQQLDMDLVGVLQKLERANDRVGERLQKETSMDITSLVTDLKAHANNVFQVQADALRACLTSSDFDGIIRHQRALVKVVEGSRPVLSPEGMAAATEILHAASVFLSPTRNNLRRFVKRPLDEEIDTTALCADLAKLQALVERSGKAAESHASIGSSSSPLAQRWIVVAEEVIVQEKDAWDSKKSRGRLVQGAVVRQMSIASSDGSGRRLQYQLESGKGPETGWVKVETQDRPLLVEADDCLELVASVGKRDSVDVHAEHDKRSKNQGQLYIGAIVRVVEERQQRLRFEKIVGKGPSRGWADMQIETKTFFAPVRQMSASTVTPDVSVQTMSEFYSGAVAQISNKLNEALGFLRQGTVTDSTVRALEYICRELDRGLHQHVVGLKFNAADELEQARERRQKCHVDYERKLLCFTEVATTVRPRLDRLQSELATHYHLDPRRYFKLSEYSEAVSGATKTILDVLKQTHQALAQGLYERAGSSATQWRHMTSVLARHLLDGRIAMRVGELEVMAKGESAALQEQLTRALERGDMSRHSAVFARYLEFVQHLATPFPDIIAMSGPLHEDMQNALECRIEQLEKHLDMCNFSQAANSLSIVREMGRILTGPYAILLDEIRGRVQDVGEGIANLHELCDRRFGGTALARHGKAFALLEVPPNASEKEIKKAYHRKCRQHHPDKFILHGAHREKPAEMMQRIQAAYDELCRADVREAYRNGTKALFDSRIRRMEGDVEQLMRNYVQEEDYVRARMLLTSTRDYLPVLAEMLQPKLDAERTSATLRSIVKNHATTLRKSMGDLWNERDLQGLQRVFTSLARIDTVFSAFEEICPSSWMEDLSTDIDAKLEGTNSKALGHLAQGEKHADMHIRDVAYELINLGRIFDELPKFKMKAETKINNILGTCMDHSWGIPYLFKLGMVLEQGKVGESDVEGNVKAADQRIGKVIVSHFRHFEDVVTYLWNEQTCAAQKDIETTVKDIKVFHANANKQALGIDRAALRSGFDAYTKEYDRLFHMWRGGELKQEDIPEQVAELAKEARVDRVADWSRTAKDAIPTILAGVAVYFTLLKSGDMYKRLLDSGSGHRQEDIVSGEGEHLDTDKILQRPHDIQILTVLRLLGVDSADTGLAPQVMQIRTGEGKSMILGLCSVIFGLFGFHVRCICYSEYLSQRDYGLFEAVFGAFGVLDAVTYSTISDYSEAEISKHGDVRELSEELLRGNLRRSSLHADRLEVQRANVEEILLVDEVDVFFGSDFYGEVYCPARCLKEPEASAIMGKVWQFKGQGVKPRRIFETIQGSTEYAQLLAKYPEWRFFLEQQVQAMCHSLEHFNEVPYRYCRAENRIGYKVMDGFSYHTTFGYCTGFAYLNEAQKKTLRDEREALDEGLCIIVSCGRFSYANINPACVLGVSGTVEALDAREWRVMNKYGIHTYTIMPSVYGPSNFVFMQQHSPIVLCSTRQDFFVAITHEVKEKTQAGRGVIVFFKTRESLAEYEDSLHFRNLPNKHLLTEEMTAQEKNYVIKKAATGRQATFTCAVFGRGTDFFCADRKLQQAGGVHVVQAFFSESMSEEIQIQGRTARQGQKGTYCMVVETGALQSTFDIKESAARQLPPAALYEMMSEKRRKKNVHKHDEIDKKLKEATKDDTLSRKYLDALVKRDVDRASAFFRELCELPEQVPADKAKGCHIVVCLDNSSWVEAQREKNIKAALRECVEERCMMGGDDDLLSVLQFGSSAQMIQECAKFKQVQNSFLRWRKARGNAAFRPAFNAIAAALDQNDPNRKALTPVVVFISCGVNCDGDVMDKVAELRADFPDLQFHAVSYARDEDHLVGWAWRRTSLQDMADAFPKGRFHKCVDGVQLSAALGEIARMARAQVKA